MTESLFVREFGHGPALLMLAGCPMPAEDLVPLAQAMSATHRVLLPDLPGYGRSAPLAAPHTLPRARAALEAMLAARGIAELAVVGFSAGAYRVLDLALHGSVRVTGVVSLGGLCGLSDAERDGFRQFAGALRAGMDLSGLMPGRMLSPQAAEHPAAAAQVTAWLKAAPLSVIADELDAFAASDDLAPALARLNAPVLARVGELDAAAPVAHSRRIVESVPRGQLQVVAGAGHALLIEDAAATIDAVRHALA